MGEVQSWEELLDEAERARKKFVKKALEGKVKWGAWRYNPENFTLEFDSRISGFPKEFPYYVDLRRCNDSDAVLDWLLQLLEKQWCTKEQVGYLLQAISELSGDLHNMIGNRRFNMTKQLIEMRNEVKEKLYEVKEVAERLNVSRLKIYRMVDKENLKVTRLLQGRYGVREIRIPESEVKKLSNRLMPKKATEDKRK